MHLRLAAPEVEQLALDIAELEDDLGYNVGAWLLRAARIEREAEALGLADLVRRARLVQADVRLRRGETVTATQEILEVHDWATEHGSRAVLERSNLLLSRTYRLLGDPATGLEHMLNAVELLDPAAPAARQAGYLTRLGDALAFAGSLDAAYARYAQAERIAAAEGDVERQVWVLNNLAYFACAAGQDQLALTTVERMRTVAATDRLGLDRAAAYLETVAKVELRFGRYAEAERTARAGIARRNEAQGDDEADALPTFLLTLATALRHLGDTAGAQENLDHCRKLCDERGLGLLGIQVQEEQAELYAAGGDLARAFETYKAFHLADKAMISEEREARAGTRQAIFETTEARRQADEFREQARRDSLTGLRNRRYVDEHLSTLIGHAVDPGVPVVVAIIDLDHFKRVNDTYSHDAGDRVLVELADLLTAAVPSTATSFTARLGGEEFVVAMTGIGREAALDRLDKLRRTVATHAWQHIADGLAVTVSIGVALGTADSTQAGLLGAADTALYAAKHGGRNRVHVDGTGPGEGAVATAPTPGVARPTVPRDRGRPARRSSGGV